MEALYSLIPNFWATPSEEKEKEESEDEFAEALSDLEKSDDFKSLVTSDEFKSPVTSEDDENTPTSEAFKEEKFEAEAEVTNKSCQASINTITEASLENVHNVTLEASADVEDNKAAGDTTLMRGIWERMDKQADMTVQTTDMTLCRVLRDVFISEKNEEEQEDDTVRNNSTLNEETAWMTKDEMTTAWITEHNGSNPEALDINETVEDNKACDWMTKDISSHLMTKAWIPEFDSSKTEDFNKNETAEKSWRQPTGDRTLWAGIWSGVDREGDETLGQRMKGLLGPEEQAWGVKPNSNALGPVEESWRVKPTSNSTMSRIWDDVNAEGNATIMSRIEAVLADLTTEYKEGSSPRRSPLPDILADHQVPTNSTMRASICPDMMPMSQDISTISGPEEIINSTPDMFTPNFTEALKKKDHFEFCWTSDGSSGFSLGDISMPGSEEIPPAQEKPSFVVHVKNGNIDTFLDLVEQKNSDLFLESPNIDFQRDFSTTIYDQEDTVEGQDDKATAAKWYFRNRSSKVGTGLATPAHKRPELGFGEITSPERGVPMSLLQDNTVVEELIDSVSYSPNSSASSASSAISSATTKFIGDESVEVMMCDLSDRIKSLRCQPMFVDPTLPCGWYREVNQQKRGAKAGEWNTFIYNDAGKKFRSKMEIKKHFEKIGETELRWEDFNFNPFIDITVMEEPTTPRVVGYIKSPKKVSASTQKKKKLFSQAAGPQMMEGPEPKPEPVTPRDWSTARQLGLSKKEYRTMARELQWLG